MSAVSDIALKTRIREQAASRFYAAGIPSRRVEEWKYSDLRVALGENGLSKETASWRVGKLPEGVDLFDLAEPIWPEFVQYQIGELKGQKETSLRAASLAFASGGFALRVDDPTDEPVEVEFSGTGNLYAVIMLYPGSSLTLIEKHSGKEQRNIGIQVILGRDAVFHHVRLAPFAAGAVQVEEVAMHLAQGAQYHAHYASFGAKLSRLELDIALEGEGAEAHLSGVSVLGDEGQADVTTRVIHAVGNTKSTQLFKKVAAGKSRAVYQGKVTVAKGADGSDSRQTAKALLLGTRAEADLKPELEIFADDVKCAHGAAVGDLDTDSLFYLRARGLPETEARALLLHAFLEDAFAGIAREDLRAQVRSTVNDALEGLVA